MDSNAFFYTDKRFVVTLKGKANESKNRQPIHLIFLIDISESMNDFNKINNVISSLTFMNSLLAPTDHVSLITFGDSSTIVCKNVPSNSPDFSHKVKSLKTNGATNMSSALIALNVVLKDDSSSMKKGVLLLTDGYANRGIYESEALISLLKTNLEEFPHVTFSSIAYGVSHNADLLKQMASIGNGSYNIVNNLEDVASVFGEIFGGLSSIVAQNVCVKGDSICKPLTSYRVDNSNTVHIGDIYSENEINILFELINPNESLVTVTVTVSGFDILTLLPIYLTIPVAPFNSSTSIPKSVEIANIRYDVTKILEKAASGSNVRQEAESMLHYLRSLSYVNDNIIQMMIDDMEIILENNGRVIYSDIRANILQHSMFLGVGRGLRSVIQEPTPFDQDPLNITYSVNSPLRRNLAVSTLASPSDLLTNITQTTRTARVNTLNSPFSNRSQTQAIQTMRHLSQIE